MLTSTVLSICIIGGFKLSLECYLRGKYEHFPVTGGVAVAYDNTRILPGIIYKLMPA